MPWGTSVGRKAKMSDLISRQVAIDAINELHELPNAWLDLAVDTLEKLPSAQPDIVEKILAAGKEGKEVRIYIGGRLFAVRELAQ